jgi:hypothetical protein
MKTVSYSSPVRVELGKRTSKTNTSLEGTTKDYLTVGNGMNEMGIFYEGGKRGAQREHHLFQENFFDNASIGAYRAR